MEDNPRLIHALNHCRKLDINRAESAPELIDGLVYFIQSGEFIKIGITTRDGLKSRLISLQTGNPVKLKLLKTISVRAAQHTEHWFHRLFKDRRVRGRGEWFKLSESELNSTLESSEAEWFNAGMTARYHP